MTDNELHTLLDRAAARINTPEFAQADPVQFARRFSSTDDIEIASLLCSTIAWGNRTMICRNCDRLLEMLGNAPADFVRCGDIEAIDPEMNIHRTFFGRNLRHYLRGLRLIYARHGSLQGFAADKHIADAEMPAWALAENLNAAFAEANAGASDSRCLPANLATTPLKRLNMALRWLVRRDGIVDLGVWDVIGPDRLYIPLDVHVANTSRRLGLLDRRTNDRRAVVELTDRLRQFNHDDPVLYDYALFGLGIESKSLIPNIC